MEPGLVVAKASTDKRAGGSGATSGTLIGGGGGLVLVPGLVVVAV
jgi:hypothetical protein